MEKKIIYRQGDVVLKRIDALPKGKMTKVKNGLLVEGEATNHAHYGCDCEVLKDEKGTLFIDATNESVQATLKHLLMNSGAWTNEHTDIALDKGVYEVVIQRMYNPFAKAIEKVRD